MGSVRCNARGCTKQLWVPHVGEQGIESSATCIQCKKVALCIDHLSVLWRRGGACPKCGGKAWSVQLFEGVPFSPMLQAELLASGGKLQMIDTQHDLLPDKTRSLDDEDKLYHQALTESTNSQAQVTLNVTANSHQTLTRRAIDPRPPHPNTTGSHDPFRDDQRYDQSDWSSIQPKHRPDPHSGQKGALPPPPKGWRLITQNDLSSRARGLKGGIAFEREGEHVVRMMDDDRIIRQLEVSGEIISISQAPRKQRLIIERSRDGWRELLYIRGKEIQGFITNPLSDECEVFGAQFYNDTGFLILVERPDQRVELREGRFKKARQVQTRVVGSSLTSVPLAPSICQRGQLAFIFKAVSEDRFLPLCRRISSGEDTVIGSEVDGIPVQQAASRDAMTIAWVTQRGELFINAGVHHPSSVIHREGVDYLAVSSDGRQVAWTNEWGFFTYHVERRQIEQWERPEGLLAVGWRSL